MLQKFFATGIALSLFVAGFSQEVSVNQNTPAKVDSIIAAPEEEKKPALSITGGADVYYKYDFGKTRFNNLTSFTNSHNTFELGMATVKLDYHTDKVGVVVDLGFGKKSTGIFLQRPGNSCRHQAIVCHLFPGCMGEVYGW